MHEFISNPAPGIVHLRVSGRLDESDYAKIVPALEARIASFGKINLLWEMINFQGWTAKGLWADTQFDIRHATDFIRVALVGEKQWQKLMTKAMTPFTSANIRYYETGERDAALKWLDHVPEK